VDIAPAGLGAAGFFREGGKRPAFVFHRRREGKARREKLRETVKVTGKLVCEVPNCGFDSSAPHLGDVLGYRSALTGPNLILFIDQVRHRADSAR
jgi:hypothetical protein